MPTVSPDDPAASGPSSTPGTGPSRYGPPLVRRTSVADALLDTAEGQRLGFPAGESEPLPVVIELNLRHPEGLTGATRRFLELYQGLPGERLDPEPELVAETYYRCRLSVEQVRALVAADMVDTDPARTALYRIWPDFPVNPLIDLSCSTVKADAARRSYGAGGRGISWAVIDSGIDADHQHFRAHDTLGGDVADLHRDFTLPGRPERGAALRDGFGHGTHVAGIIAGGLAARHVGARGVQLRVVERVVDPNQTSRPRLHERKVDPQTLAGMAPECKLVSLKALDDNGGGSSMNVVRALEYVRKELNGSGKLLRVQGVNLSVGYEFDAKWFACGQSPICAEVDRLVRSGVVVLVAAGERITSCAAGKELASVSPDAPPPGPRQVAVYVEDSGTSMAAPHVSGAIAAFLSIRREFIGQPDRVKRIFLESATSLGRERYFQGSGLVDLMRAIQSGEVRPGTGA